MENFSYSSYPDSRDSSPRSRDLDSENQSWDEPPANYKVKLMCSYGGKIQPRPHDNQLAYTGGDTKILAVDRNIKFPAIMAKLSSLCDAADVCFKYQLPGEDLDALISVTNDEDLEHMMLEYDRLCRASTKPARLRLFLFPLNLPVASATAAAAANEPRSERQWFVEALNSVQIQSLEGSSPSAMATTGAAVGNPDFLFGLDKGYPAGLPPKFQESVPAPTIPEVMVTKDVSAGSDAGSEDRQVSAEPLVSPTEIHRQMQELQRLQIAAGHEQAALQRKIDEGNARMYSTGDFYGQKVGEKIAPAPGAVPLPVQMPIPAAYALPERHLTTAGYPLAAAPTGAEQPVYLIPGPAGGMYQLPPGMRPVPGPSGGQAFYGVQRVVQDVYREQPVYNAVSTTASLQQPAKVGTYTEGITMVPQPKAAVAEQGYVQLGYDSSGRQVFGLVPQYQPVAVGGGSPGTLNLEGKVVVNSKGPQTSSM